MSEYKVRLLGGGEGDPTMMTNRPHMKSSMSRAPRFRTGRHSSHSWHERRAGQ